MAAAKPEPKKIDPPKKNQLDSNLRVEPEVTKSSSVNPMYALIAILLLVGAAFTWFTLSKSGAPAEIQVPILSPEPLTLTLLSPQADSVAYNDEVLVSGMTTPNTTVIIYTDSDETVVESDGEGYFESTVLLKAGSNTLVVTAFSDSGDEATASVTITIQES